MTAVAERASDVTTADSDDDRLGTLTAFLAAIREAEAAVKEERVVLIERLRARGWTWQDIGDAAGITRARAQQLSLGVSGGKRWRDS